MIVYVVSSLAGPSSPWWGYLQSLPKHVDLPTFWGIESNTNTDSIHAFEWLQGTELLKHVQVDQIVTVVREKQIGWSTHTWQIIGFIFFSLPSLTFMNVWLSLQTKFMIGISPFNI